MFLIAAVIAAAGFCIIWLLQEQPLRETVADQGIRDSFATPREITSLDELETRLGILEQKHERHRVYDRLAGRAGLDLTAQQAWLLLRLHDPDTTADAALMTDETGAILDELRARSLAEPDSVRLTAAGTDAATRLERTGRDSVTALLEGWEPEEHPEVLQMIRRFARSLSTGPPAPEPA